MKTILFAIFLSLIMVQPAQALSCVQPPPPEVEFERTKIVFTGRPIEVQYADPNDPRSKNFAKFQVHKLYKGHLQKEVLVETEGIWGIKFQMDTDYLVYLDQTNPYQVSLCKTGTMELSQAGERIRQIESWGNYPYPPAASSMDVEIPPPSDTTYLKYIYGGIAIFAVLFALNILMKK
jgi:hypothetical protein